MGGDLRLWGTRGSWQRGSLVQGAGVPKGGEKLLSGGEGGCGQKPDTLQWSPSEGRRKSLQEELLAGGLSKSGWGEEGVAQGRGLQEVLKPERWADTS